MAPARLFPSVKFSNLSLSFLCLFPSSCRGPVEPALMGVGGLEGVVLALYGVGVGRLLAR